jgi:hypothetical protein
MPSKYWMIYQYSLDVSSTLMVIIVGFRKSSSFETSPIPSYAFVRPLTLPCHLLGRWTTSMSNSSINNNHRTNWPLEVFDQVRYALVICHNFSVVPQQVMAKLLKRKNNFKTFLFGHSIIFFFEVNYLLTKWMGWSCPFSSNWDNVLPIASPNAP